MPASRTSIYTGAFSHSNPIPAACRMGNLVAWLDDPQS